MTSIIHAMTTGNIQHHLEKPKEITESFGLLGGGEGRGGESEVHLAYAIDEAGLLCITRAHSIFQYEGNK